MFHTAQTRQYLKTANFTVLFIEELGWDRHVAELNVAVADQTYSLRAIAVKRGVIAYQCSPGANGAIPLAPVRRTIDQAVTRVMREHIIVYVNAARTEQIWQWVRRAAGQATVPQEYSYQHGQSGDLLLQRLHTIAFTLDEEASLTLTDVNQRVRAAFDVERITKRFYERFQVEHAHFTTQIAGIPDLSTQRWYTSVLLNRLMFTYFIQKKRLLNDDLDYLRTHFVLSQRNGRNRYFCDFLQPLFFEGLARPREQRSPDTLRVLGAVPYLNGGLFQLHRIERQYGGDIVIADDAFERPLNFFDSYRWHLDDRPLHGDREINPEVLGYMFEKYINQKQMGAYYTKEDITGYIARSSIIPALFDSASTQYPRAFVPDGSVWTTLRSNPDCYIHKDMQHGTDKAFPADVQVGLGNVEQRQLWNTAAPAEYGLPTEIWREVVVRQQRCAELYARLSHGEFRSINDLVSWNVDLDAYARDVIATTDDPDLLLAFWNSIEQITVLDPTCGSGAFLFAALNVLQPLYEHCLDAMALLLHEQDGSAVDQSSPACTTFRAVLDQVAQHPNRAYFVLKSIIVNNLYGVDIMEEAVEICKLRLFLKLAAQIEHDATLPNLGAEPLPDIDFNIVAGNALVGYATYNEVKRAVSQTVSGQSRLPLNQALEQINTHMQQVDVQFARFRQAQLFSNGTAAPNKLALQDALDGLDDELNRYLASEYGVSSGDEAQFMAWRSSHTPFHWLVKFYHVLRQRGGFDVVIGNPPYVGYPKVKSLYTVRDYTTARCANLYAFAVERSLALLRDNGRYGMIVPIASVSTEGMHELQALYAGYRQWHSHWAVRPGKLFVGVDMNLTISLLQKTVELEQSHTTGYRRWSSGIAGDRPYLFTTLSYTRNPQLATHANPYPKLGSDLEARLLARMLAHERKLRHYTDPIGEAIYYHSGGRYWRKALLTKLSSHYKPVYVPHHLVPVVFALLNSQLFYWYWIANSNCMDVVSREVLDLPVFPLDQADSMAFRDLMDRLLTSYYASNSTRVRRGERINVEEINFDVQQAKPVIDEIDFLLACYYGFTDDELDFVLNYDIKFRVNQDTTSSS